MRMKMIISNLQISLFIFFLAFSSLHDAMTLNPCNDTLHPPLCVSTLSHDHDGDISLPEIISSTINHTISQVHETYANITKYSSPIGDMLTQRALNDCSELLNITNIQLNTSNSKLLSNPNAKQVQDVQALMSAAATNPRTCLEGLVESKNKNISDGNLKKILENISNEIDNALGMVARLHAAETGNSSLTWDDIYPMSEDGYPHWMNKDDRDIFSGSMEAKYDSVVAQVGNGSFNTITDAVNAAPSWSSKRFRIYIKQGVYFENVEVPASKKNIMFLGDGINKTWIKGKRNVIDGWTTYHSAVLAVEGEGFIAMNLTIENYAGPDKHQAVALRTSADHTAFFRCSFLGYQDTLYVHSLRQFYRECDIHGTIDFIFGNAAAVLQKCNIYARKPLPLQKNVFTAQGRASANETTGISIMESKIEAASDFAPSKLTTQSYLGRPWKPFSRTVISKCFIGDLIHPLGWLEFSGDVGLDTLYYREYMNKGPGAHTDGRVKWPGYKVITDKNEAMHFTVRAFIQGDSWLKNTSIPFYLDLPPN